MKRNCVLLLPIALVAVASLAGCSRMRGDPKLDAAGTQNVPGAQSDIHVVSPVSSGQWLTPEGDLAERASALSTRSIPATSKACTS